MMGLPPPDTGGCKPKLLVPTTVNNDELRGPPLSDQSGPARVFRTITPLLVNVV